MNQIPYEGKNRRTVNYLKTIYFDHPEWTPWNIYIMPGTWTKYRSEAEDIVLRHPRLFPGYRRGDRDFDLAPDLLYEGGQHRDCWGALWDNLEPGLSSIVIEEPLHDWAAFESWTPPDPLRDDVFGPRDWDKVARDMQAARERGDLATGGGLQHGLMYMRLYYLRGFENLMLDLATADPRLDRLIEIVLRYNVAVIQKYLELGAEYISLGDDLGQQRALPVSPAMWRRVFKPCFEAIIGPCRDRGVPVYLHTDGHVLEIIPDLIDCGVRVINPQIGANGLEGLQRYARGRVAINIDFDRQFFPFATPSQVEDHLHKVFEGLYLPEGGLMVYAVCGPDVSLENIERICCTLEVLCHPPAPEVV
jgi:hypothetical protein